MYKRNSKYTLEKLQEAVSKSTSFAQVIKGFNLKLTGGNYTMIKSRIKNYGIDTSHFKDKGWSKGLTKETSESVARVRSKMAYTREEILCKNSPQTKGTQLKKLMIEEGIFYVCSFGHKAEWMGKPLTLHVDHIDGDRTNNEITNLRFLCPNCHQQTETWGNKIKPSI